MVVPKHAARVPGVPLAQEVFDVTGVGDTVVATLAPALVTALPLEGAVELTSASAAVSVSKRGTSAVSPGQRAGAAR